MSVVEGPGGNALVERVRLVLTQPTRAWEVIDGEATTVRDLYLGYACILAAIGPVAGLIGRVVFQFAVFGFLSALADAIIAYALNLALVFVVAMVTDAMAPSFDGQKNQVQAFKSIVYGCTAAWVGGVFSIVPELARVGTVLGVLYSLYLLWLGAPKLMKVPPEKALGFTFGVLLAFVVSRIVLEAVAGIVF